MFRAAGFSLRGFSPLDGLRMVLDPVYENGNCSNRAGYQKSSVSYESDSPDGTKWTLPVTRNS